MSKKTRGIVAMLMTGVMVLSPTMTALSGVFSFASDTEEEMLFQTSFEKGEEEIVGKSQGESGVIQTAYGIKGKGFEVRLDSVQGMEDYLGSENKFNLFDGKTSTKFLTNHPSGAIWFALKEPSVVNTYELASANDEPGRDPKSWVLYGSRNGSDWTVLDERKGETFTGRFQTKKFSFDNTLSYEWYKLEVKENCGAGMLQFSSLELYYSEGDEGGDEVSVDFSTLTGTTPDSATQGFSCLFDGDVSTKYLTRSNQAKITFALNKAAVIKRYAITSANDHEPRDPKDWILSGSNDGNSWVELDRRTGEDFAGRFTANEYRISQPASYLWYKLEITDNHGKDAVGLTIVQMAELTLYTTEENSGSGSTEEIDPNSPFSVVESTVKGTAEISQAEGKKNLFDGQEATKAVFSAKSFWVSFRVNRADTVTAYSMTSANDWANRDPKNWTVYGSNDGESWTVVDEKTDMVFSGRYETKIFRLATPVSYLYYKLEVKENAGNPTYTQLSDFILMTSAEMPEPVPGMTAKKDFGPTQTDTGKPGSWTGNSCLAVYGEQNQTEGTYARVTLFEGLTIPVTRYTTFSYLIFPGLFNIKTYDYEYTSCRVMIDLHFTDGTVLSGMNALDQHGSVMSPAGQVAGECLVTEQWNYIESCIGDVASGKTIDRIDVYFSMEQAEDASKFITFFDDVKIENKEPVVCEHLSGYINILRGTNNDSAFSRGLCTPAVTVPNGFNFYSPVTNPSKNTACYNYQVNGENNPLDSITVTHAPSYWLSSYGTWQFMANTSVDGSGSVTAAMISSDARKAKFTHENEVAHAHYYSVTLNEGTAASGVKIEVVPTSHAAYIRFTFPADAENANVIFDSLWGTGTLTFGEDGQSFKAQTNHTSAGGGKMYVVGRFDSAWAKAKTMGTKQGMVSFEKGTTVVTMKIATSFLSYEQAEHSMALEIGSKDFKGVFAAAQGAWDALCGRFEIEGASFTQLQTFYSCLYRMYAYPNLHSENEGTNENPVWVYASPSQRFFCCFSSQSRPTQLPASSMYSV